MFKADYSCSSNTSNTSNQVRRDSYSAISEFCLPAETEKLIEQVKQAAGWETGITGIGKRGGFESRNIDVYGFDVERKLAVIQIRRAWKKKESWYTEVTKVYALVGLDEGQLFSHPLASSPRRNPHLHTMAPEGVVRWAESKIFGVPLNKLHTIVRQGDIAFVPVRGIPKDADPLPLGDYGHAVRDDGVHTMTWCGSHDFEVDGDIFETDSSDTFVVGTIELSHNKHEHKPITVSGKFKVVLGDRAYEPWWIDAALGD